MNQAKQFLEALFGGKEEHEYVLLWTLDGRRSSWYKDLDQAVAFADANQEKDLYVGVTLSPKDHGPTLRLKISGAERMPSSIVALWSDIDIANPGHKKTNLPTTVEDAKSVLFPELPPSIIIHSGGGLQAWWLFKEPERLDNEGDVRRFGALATRWIRALRARAAARGWDLDSVGDLTRVLRIPGTMNCKIPGKPRPVAILEENENRYNPKDLDEYLDMVGAEHVAPATVATTVVPGEALEYSSNAEPPLTKFMATCEADPKFKASWDHFRKDLQDQSASSYDMALANIAAMGGWSDQEIANLLIAHRRRFNQDLKLRDSYYLKTIGKARSLSQADPAMERIREIINPDPEPAHDEDGERKEEKPDMKDPLQEKAALVDAINIKLQLDEKHQIIRIKRYNTEPAQYEVQTRAGDIRLGPIEGLSRQDRFANSLLDIAQVSIPLFKKDWPDVALALRKACVDVQVGEQGTEAGLVNSWMGAYLSDKAVLDEFVDDAHTRQPFMSDGKIHIHMVDFRKWIQVNHGDRVAPKEMSVIMRRAGHIPVKVPCNKGKSTRQFWALADAVAAPAKPEVPDWVGEAGNTE